MRRALLPILLVALVGVNATAQEPAPEAAVYVTKAGKKYHKESCKVLKRSKIRIGMSRKEAKEKGFTPCKVCKP